MRKVEKPWGHEVIWAETPNYVGKAPPDAHAPPAA